MASSERPLLDGQSRHRWRGLIVAFLALDAAGVTIGVVTLLNRPCIVCSGVLHDTWLGAALGVGAILPLLVAACWTLGWIARQP